MCLHMRCIKCNFVDIILYENGKLWKCPNCELNQPERSKREDFYKKMAREYLDKREYWEGNPSDKIVIECFADFLDRRCGTLNSMETC